MVEVERDGVERDGDGDGVERVRVEFAGEGSGEGELTWGQRAAWRTFVADGEAKLLGGVVRVPPTSTVERVADSLRFVMSRHQALRTRLRFGPDGEPRQVVDAAGAIDLEVVDVPAGQDADEAAERVRRRLVTTPFDYERDWPVRMAMLRQDGRTTHTVAVYLQTSLDAYGLAALTRDLLGYLAGAPLAPVTAIQPLELAAKQGQPTARRQGEASLRHMEQVLRSVPLRRFPESTRPGEPDWDTLHVRSTALAAAVGAVAARRGIDTSPVLLGAYAVGLASVTGVSPVAMLVAVSNRFRPRAADSVSPLAQVATVLVDVADTSLDEVVGRAWQAAMSAYKHAYYPPAERTARARELGATRGGPRDLSCYFNDRRGQGVPLGEAEAAPPPADLRAALAGTELVWRREPGFPQEIAYLNVDEGPGEIRLGLTVDTTVLSRPATERLVRAMEEAAVDLVLDPGRPTGIGAAAPVGAL
jgi:hypothetical protein